MLIPAIPNGFLHTPGQGRGWYGPLAVLFLIELVLQKKTSLSGATKRSEWYQLLRSQVNL